MVVYVDGFNLYHGIHDWSRCRWLWLDLPALAKSLRPRNEVAKVHYFTAPVMNDVEGGKRQQVYQNALNARYGDLIEITQGRYQRKTHTCRKCNYSYRSWEEKETDVSIAANIVADAALKKYDSALIISADSDLIPAIRIARSLHPDQFSVAGFPPNRKSDELQRVLPKSFHIGKAKIKASQLPATVRDKVTGKTFSRPEKWSPDS